MTIVPRSLELYTIDRGVIAETEAVLVERGRQGFEAVVLWVGRPDAADPRRANIHSAVIPEQIAYRGEDGVCVEVTQHGIRSVVSDLGPGSFVLARVHSHPSEAYHSSTDDLNMLISHERAISIVVPNFASDGFHLAECSVNELRHGEGWIELSSAEVRDRFVVA